MALTAQLGVAGVGGAGVAIPQAFPDDHDETDEQARNGGGNHDQTDKADRAKHDVAHRDFASNRRLADGLDDDRTGLLEQQGEHGYFRLLQDSALSASSASVRTPTPVAPFG